MVVFGCVLHRSRLLGQFLVPEPQGPERPLTRKNFSSNIPLRHVERTDGRLSVKFGGFRMRVAPFTTSRPRAGIATPRAFLIRQNFSHTIPLRHVEWTTGRPSEKFGRIRMRILCFMNFRRIPRGGNCGKSAQNDSVPSKIKLEAKCPGQ